MRSTTRIESSTNTTMALLSLEANSSSRPQDSSTRSTSNRKHGKRRCPTSPVQRTSSKQRLDIPVDALRIEEPSTTKREARRNTTPTRQVAFELDEQCRIKTHVRRIHNRLELDDEDLALLYWDQNELDEIMEREQDVFEVFSKCCSSYVDSVIRVWDECNAGANDKGSSSSKVVSSANDIQKIASAPARGMENDVVISVVPGYRAFAIKSVIDTQRDMAEADHKIRASTVRRRYRSCSKAASMFARRIAHGDAQVAAAIHQ